MKNHHTLRAEADETAIAVQEAPAVNGLVFMTAGLGALLPAICAALLWAPLSFTKGTEARR